MSRRLASLAIRLHRDQSGAAAVLLALSAPALAGLGAVSVDLASLYLAERNLQGVADSAAAAAVAGDIETQGRGAAEAVLARKGLAPGVIEAFEPGTYTRDPDIAFDDRFDPTGTEVNAARVTLRQEVPLFFASMFFGRNDSTVVARATASRNDMVAFDLGSKLLSLSGGLPNKFLSQLAGTELSLSDEDIARLVETQVDVMSFAEALRSRQGDVTRNFGQVFDANSGLANIVDSIAEASSDPATAAILKGLMASFSGDGIVMSELIDLGPLRLSDVNDGRAGITVDAYTLLRSVLEASHGTRYVVQFATDVPGMAAMNVRIVGGYGYERSPWMSISEAGQVTLHTALTRIYLQGDVGTALPQMGLAHLPVYSELAPAEAQITQVECNPDDVQNGATVEVKPSLGTVALADVDLEQFDNLATSPSLHDAAFVNSAVFRVTGFAKAQLGGLQSQQLHFSLEEIRNGMRKEAGTTDIAEGTTQSLLDTLSFSVETVGLSLGLPTSTVANATRAALSGVTSQVDDLLGQLSNIAGVKIGVAETGIVRLRCGTPALVG